MKNKDIVQEQKNGMHTSLSRNLIVILGLAFLLRLGLLLATLPVTSRAISPDTNSYMEYARAIFEGNLWSFPTAKRTPVYPLFLAIFQMQIIPVILAQIILSLLTIYFTYRITRYFFEDENTALLASALLAFSLESITHTYYILTETLFTLIFIVSVAILLRARNQRALGWVALSAALMALAILTRPIAIFYPVIILAFLLWESSPWRIRLQKVMLYTGITLLIMGAWVARNAVVINLPTISTISNNCLLYYNAASLEAERTGRNEYEIRKELAAQVIILLAERNLPNTEANQSLLANELGTQIILSDPLQFALVHLKSDLNSLLPDTDLLEILGFTPGQKGTLDLIKQKGLLAGIEHYFNGNYSMLLLLTPFILILLIIYAGALIALLNLLWRRQLYPLAFLALPIFYGLLLPGSPSNPRFRVPVMPFFTILAAYGLVFLYKKWRKT